MNHLWVLIILTNLVYSFCNSSEHEPERDQALIYLARYGYLDNVFESNQLADGKVINNAISEFQALAGLEVTGELNDDTVKKMTQPRCGMKDKIGTGNDYRSKRYALQGSRWRVKDLTYKVTKYHNKLSKKDTDETFAKAFAIWSEKTDLTFTPAKENANIDIRFESRDHGDEGPFDGKGGVLAHAHFPVYGGSVHFDSAESWSTDPDSGTHLLQVSAHEFGHALGLSHSDVYQALMKPFYDHYKSEIILESDDIQAIETLYGKKSDKPEKVPTKTTTEEPDPDISSTDDPILCKDGKIDTIFTNEKGKTYVFKGLKYWQLGEDGIVEGHLKLISQRWPGLKGPIDAAFTYKNGRTFFFKGDQYWLYMGYTMIEGYPKKISEGFPGIPNDIDAAMIWSGNGKLYFFKGANFWRFDPNGKPRKVKSTYPKKVSFWNGIPDNIDAAFHYTNERTYFFKDEQFYRFNDTDFAVDNVTPSYPKSIKRWWFDCSDAPSGTVGNLIYRGWNELVDAEDTFS